MNNRTYPPIVVVDENDREIGSAPLDEVLEKGLYHRIVSVFVRDEHERILLQLRGPHVKIFPNCWDPAAGGHVDMGNSYEQTALMEAKEELGLRDISLKLLGTHRSNTPEGDRIINEFERAYLVQITHDTPLKPQPEEISALRWFDPAELKREVAANPSKFTSGLLYGLRQYFPSIGL